MKKIILLVIFAIGLAYILAPSPESINEIPSIPNSLKSSEPGDTHQNTNIAAYFSDYWRNELMFFYTEEFKKLNFFGFYIPPIRLNHPPEEAFGYIRDQQKSTFLEQLTYPMRGSLFINGYEPVSKQGKKFDGMSAPIEVENRVFISKTTLRYYPAPIYFRITGYVLMWAAAFALVYLIRESRRKGYL